MEEMDVAPSIALLESIRSVGYSLNAAVADLIDNSISADATRVDVDLEPAMASYVAVLDDGVGMSPDAAVSALRLAGSVGDRSAADLGRFGLGLKTASLSQARCLTVVTKNREQTTGWRWDIDHVKSTGRWSLLQLSDDEIADIPWAGRLHQQSSGTLVVWTNLDVLIGDAPDPGEAMRQRIRPLVESLSLVFHRYIKRRAKAISIAVNGNKVAALDPFLTSNSKTQVSPTQRISIGGSSVKVTAYTLPHVSGLTPEERQRPDLGMRMREAQGFYIYRNERLISHGHWYGLARMDEISKQTRVQVDVPNSIDSLWQLDIKKSRAEPPASFKTELRRIINGLIEKGRRVHTYRGRKEVNSNAIHLWEKVRERDGFRYEVNLDNPLVSALLSGLPALEASRVLRLLESLADALPMQDVFVEMAGNVPVAIPNRVEDAALDSLRLLRDSGSSLPSVEGITAMLAHVEPFSTMSGLEEKIRMVWQEKNE